MTIPAKVRALLAHGDVAPLDGLLNDSEDGCEGARFHSPSPLLIQRVPLVPASWPRTGEVAVEEVCLCGVCAGNLAVYQHLLWQTDGQIEWAVRREFGNAIRALGERSWKAYMGQRVEA